MTYELVACNYSTETHLTQIIFSFLIWVFLIQKIATCLRDPVTQREYVQNLEIVNANLRNSICVLNNEHNHLESQVSSLTQEVERYRNGVRNFVDLLPPHHDTQG